MSEQAYTMGWLRDLPDFRDHTPDTSDAPSRRKRVGQTPVRELLGRVGVGSPSKKLERKVDLRTLCPEIEDQGTLGSCTANAGVALVEFLELQASGRYLDASRLFLYKATRNLLRLSGDTGAYLRSTMQAMTLFGMPPEEYWPYSVADFDREPSAFCYAFAQAFQAIDYYRLDPPGTSPASLLERIKTNLAAKLPSMFGFSVYASYTQGASSGRIPFPSPAERIVGGHAVVAVGYDDGLKIKNTGPGGLEKTGAIIIRNSWGTSWGEAGYGYLPYDYVLQGLAVDWWSVIKNEWVDSNQFKL